MFQITTSIHKVFAVLCDIWKFTCFAGVGKYLFVKALPLDVPLGNNIWAIPLNEGVRMLGYVYSETFIGVKM